MTRREIVSIGIIVLFFAAAIYFYPQMPERMASHWNARGEVDGYISRFWGVFLLPFMSIGLALLLGLIPRLDPLKANIGQFRKYYDWFVALMLVFLFYLYLLTIFWNIGLKFNLPQLLAPAFGALFYYVGVLLEKAKKNWSIGIRTPWTLSNEEVWEKTHRLGGRLFKIAGILALLGVFFPGYAIFFILIPVLAAAIYLVVYSYIEYQKVVKRPAA